MSVLSVGERQHIRGTGNVSEATVGTPQGSVRSDYNRKLLAVGKITRELRQKRADLALIEFDPALAVLEIPGFVRVVWVHGVG